MKKIAKEIGSTGRTIPCLPPSALEMVDNDMRSAPCRNIGTNSTAFGDDELTGFQSSRCVEFASEPFWSSGLKNSSVVPFCAVLPFITARYSPEVNLGRLWCLEKTRVKKVSDSNESNTKRRNKTNADWISSWTMITRLWLGPRLASSSSRNSWLIFGGFHLRREAFETRAKWSVSEMAKRPQMSDPALSNREIRSRSLQSFSCRRSTTSQPNGASLRIE